MLSCEQIRDAGLALIALRECYSRPPSTERSLDPVLFGYLCGRFTNITRQHKLVLAGSKRPKRIDFRAGTGNPTVLEFAVRPPTGGQFLMGPQNRSELIKLSKVTNAKAKSRVLLLVDLAPRAIAEARLRGSYAPVNSGPGRWKRHSVRVIYVHKTRTYDFLWRPGSE